MLYPLHRRRHGALGLAGLLTLGLCFIAPTAAHAQDVFKQSLATPGDTKPIRMYADEILTWQEGPERAFLLRGKVWVEQGLTSLRLREGVAWVNEQNKQTMGIYNLTVYGEGSAMVPAILEQGSSEKSGPRALVQLATRGEVSIKTNTSKIQQKNLAADPLYQRAVAVRHDKDNPVTTTTTLPRPAEPQGPPGQTIGAPPQGGTDRLKPGLQPPPAPFLATPDAGKVIQAVGAERSVGTSPPALTADFIATTVPQPFPGFPSSPGYTGIVQAANQPLGSKVIANSQNQDPFQPPPSPGAAGFPPTLPPAPAPIPTANLPVPPPAEGPARLINIRPRSTQDIQAIRQLQPNGETAITILNGCILTVSSPKDKKVLIDIEADRVVFWTRGAGSAGSADPFSNMKGPQGETSKQMEFFLSGNVEIRNQTGKETQTLRAQEVYYDVGRNVAVALKGDVEIRSPKSIFPLHFKADELLQLGPKVFQGRRSEAFSTVLPSDPGLKIEVQEATLEEIDTPRKNIFGRPYYDIATGQPKTTPQRIFTGKNAWLTLEGVPISYFPYIRTDAEDPLGPLDGISFNYSGIFGFQVFTTWNIFDLLGLAPEPGMRWQLLVDYMTERGPALGTDFRAAGKDLFGFANQYESLFKAYGIYDTGTDRLGGDRGTMAFTGPYTSIPITHPDFRGWVQGKLNVFDMPYGFSFQGQVAAISDRNFLEQFFNQEWTRELNQETFAYLKQQQSIWAWTLLAEERIRPWITETNWLPKVDGYVQGLKIFDVFTYNVRGDAGFGQLRPASVVPSAYLPTDVQTNTGRFDLFQELSLPLRLGDVNIVPYAVLDLAYYTQDLSGNSLGRLYGGGGVRGSVPFSRLFPDVQSDLFNVDSIFHKIVFSGNYYNVQSSAHINQLPQLDRLNDDASDQALRDIHPRYPALNPSNAAFLQFNPIVDPQNYALRRLIDNRIDTLDTLEVLQLGVRQRWQTKRGFPGNEHVVDWMVLDLQGSVFPHSNRDNFGQTFGVLQYDWLWNIGDRTAVVSNGWMETLEEGPKVFNVGTIFNRPDRTNVYLGYRQIDPLNSKAVVASLTYAFSAKYAATASTIYDFGVHNQTNTIMLSRIGTDLRFSFGVSYNSVLENFGVLLEIVPNLLPGAGRFGSVGGLPGSTTGPGMAGSSGSSTGLGASSFR